MMKLILGLAAFSSGIAIAAADVEGSVAQCGGVKEAVAVDLAGWVDPFIGTSATGHTFPAACVPFGLVQAGPDTVGLEKMWWHYCGGYRYEDNHVRGFSQTHLNGTGGIDLGDVLILPFFGERGA